MDCVQNNMLRAVNRALEDLWGEETRSQSCSIGAEDETPVFLPMMDSGVIEI